MNDLFERRVQAAAVAGWWVVLAGAAVLIVSWLGYLFILPTRPEWLMRLWGSDMNWEFIQSVWFWGVGVFKLIVWLMALVALWLTLWARQLRKAP